MKAILRNCLFLLFSLVGTTGLQAQETTHWQCDAYVYQYDMTAYAALSIGGVALTDYSDYEIAAFCGTECRGVATIQSSEKDGQTTTYGYLRIRSNQQSGETISFKVYQKSVAKEVDIYQTTIEFQSQQLVGLPSSPMMLQMQMEQCSVVVSCEQTMGTVTGGGMYDVGSTVVLTAMPAEGYHFVAWSDGAEANPYEFVVEEDVELVATFAPNQYAMTFVLGNGEENVVKTQDYGLELTAPTGFARTGYTFAGWNPEVPATVPAQDQTFTAQWERNSYKLTRDVDGVKTESTVAFEAPITKPEDPQKEGYTFAGWTPEVAETMPAEDVTYTATWTVNQYTMTFVLDNGQDNIVKIQDYASELTAPADVQKTGFTFKGWSPEVPATVPAQDQTFTAQWERNSYKLTWDVDGVKTESTVAFEAPITKPEDPVKEGYTFAGWTPEVAETMPAEDVTYTAQWEVNVYAIVYMVNGVEWARDSVAYGDEVVLRDYKELGSMYEGWLFQDGESYQTMPAHDVIVVAAISTGVDYLRQDKQLVDVYDIRGRLVRRNMNITDMRKSLPAGVYIVAGRKIVIR